MRTRNIAGLMLFLLFLALPARAQFVSVAGGALFPQDRSAAAVQGRVGGPALANFNRPSIITADAGAGLLPFLSAGVHYSFSEPRLSLSRGDSFGSRADVDLKAHTVTLDARLRTPQAFGFRAFGLLGGGFTRFNLNVRNQVEVPFPGGAPSSITTPVFTYGGGVEQSVLPYVRLKFEVRDYVAPISERFFQPGGAWHRVAIVGGITLGR